MCFALGLNGGTYLALPYCVRGGLESEWARGLV
jgi:hypothetical protein